METIIDLESDGGAEKCPLRAEAVTIRSEPDLFVERGYAW